MEHAKAGTGQTGPLDNVTRKQMCSNPLWSLDKRYPISPICTHNLANDQMITRIHGADVNFLVGQDYNHAIFDVNDDALIDIRAPDRKLLEHLKVRLAAPRARVSWINVRRDQLAIRLHAQDYLAPVRAPVVTQVSWYQPGAIEVDALDWPLRVNCASAAAGSARRRRTTTIDKAIAVFKYFAAAQKSSSIDGLDQPHRNQAVTWVFPDDLVVIVNLTQWEFPTDKTTIKFCLEWTEIIPSCLAAIATKFLIWV
jgi:hypothetical protein